MRLPTLEAVATAAGQSARRFPFVLLAGAAAAAFALLAAERTGDDRDRWAQLLLTASLGIPLMFGLTVLAERRARNELVRALMFAAGLAVLFAFWVQFPTWTDDIQVIRYTQLSAAFHLFVAFAPYADAREGNGFWQYNRILFLRFVQSAVYSAVLYAGLAVALLAVNRLFEVNVPREAYLRLWIVIAFLFNTWHFVGGVPGDFEALEKLDDYPTPLRVLVQFILVPIVAIYLAILTLYLVKVVVTHQWPSGWIGWLVSSVAAAGLFAWLLVHPLEERKDYAWVKPFTRGYHILLLPSIAMLWLAIWKRVDQYGVTERRYFLIVLSVWLAGIALFYTVSRSRSIRLIPVSLCALALITFSGPVGAYSVSLNSQRSRLAAILEDHGLLANGHLAIAKGSVSDTVLKETSAGFRYLFEVHGVAAVRPWIAEGPLRLAVVDTGRGHRWTGEQDARALMEKMGLRYIARYEVAGSPESFSFYVDQRRVGVPIGGYTWAIHLTGLYNDDSLIVTDGVYLRAIKDSLALQLSRDGRRVLVIPLAPMVDSASAWQRGHSNQSLPRDMLSIEAEEGNYKAMARFQSIMGSRKNGVGRITMLEGELFLQLP